MVLAGGMRADQLNLDAFLAQAREYEDWDDPGDRVRRFFYEINSTHPYAVRRVSEIMHWVQSGEYDRIQRGDYIRRGHEPPVNTEASAAFDFYAERFRAIFRDVGENVTKLGNQVGGVAEQVADWLRARRGPGDAGGSGGSGGSGTSGGPGSSAVRAARAVRAVRAPRRRRPAAANPVPRPSPTTKTARTTPTDRAIGGPPVPYRGTQSPSTHEHRAGSLGLSVAIAPLRPRDTPVRAAAAGAARSRARSEP